MTATTNAATGAAATAARPATLLRRAIQVDGAVCLVGGIATAAAAGALAPLTGIPAAGLQVTGALLALWGAGIFYGATRPKLSRRFAIAVIVLNLLWVLDSAVLLASGWLPLTTLGFWLVVAQAALGADVALVQYVGLRREPTA